MRFVAAALSLVVFVAACGKALPDTPSADTHSTANPALDGPKGMPYGLPLVYGWDGVDGRMLMGSLLKETGQVDPSTWSFTGGAWLKASIELPEIAQGTLTYDPGRNRLVLVGRAFTWEWDGQSWRQALRSVGQGGGEFRPQRFSAYSPEMKATVVIQADYGFEIPPTWQWDGTSWRSVLTANPPPRGPLAYDSKRHSIIGLSLGDYSTWQFDGHDWTPIAQNGVASPAVMTGMGRMDSAVAFDQKRGLWVVFGGSDAVSGLTDTWTGDGTRWTKRSPTISPPARRGLDYINYMAWDPSHSRVVLFGGRDPSQTTSLGDTWAWDGSNWTHVAGSSSPAYPASSSTRLTSP
jgi:hypothetical protein